MNDSIPLDTWNRMTLALMQALLGAVSPNFRMVTLANEDGVWKLKFVLEAESEVDRGEIEDIATEFEALQDSSLRYEVETTITAAGLTLWPPSPTTRTVYLRRETCFMPELASVSYRLFEGEEPAIEAARDGELHDFGGELVLTFEGGLRIFISWVGEPVQYAVGIKESSHFVPDAALSEFDVSATAMWTGLVGKELSLGFVAAHNQVLKLSSQGGEVFVCSFERGGWWADELTISQHVPVPYDAEFDGRRPMA